MKNITLALAIALGFCATEAGAQARGLGSLRERRALRVQQRAEEAKAAAEKARIAEEREAEKYFEALIAGGDANQKLKQLEEDTSKARVVFEKMLALEEKSKTLSADALAIYKDRLNVMKREYATFSNQLARARALLTPEKVAEMEKRKKVEEEKKARKQKAEEEYRAFVADVGNEFETYSREVERAKERAQREKEREMQRLELMKIQEELRKAREERAKAEESGEKKGE